MRTLYLMLMAVLLAFFNGKAQLAYDFTAQSGTYTAITGTPVGLIVAQSPFDAHDEGIASNIPIGFNFTYNNIVYSTISACSNGFASFAALTPVTNAGTEDFYTPDLGFGPFKPNSRPILAPLWDDHDLFSAPDLTYLTTGTAGSRIFTLQWGRVYWDLTALQLNIEFQIKLYEGTNVIEFRYHQLPGALGNYPAAAIGISATATGDCNFLALTNSSASPGITNKNNNIDITTKPAEGQIYRFTPRAPSPCDCDLTAPVITPKNTTVYIGAGGTASVQPADVVASVTDNCDAPASITLAVAPNSFTCANIGAMSSGGGGGTVTTNHQAYIANSSAGDQGYFGEVGMEFIVNPGPGIVINQLGAFDHQANGISGTQGGGVRVAIFNKNTQAIVPGLDATIVGAGDGFAFNHRLKNITPVTLAAGTYVVVAKGYNSGELLGNSFLSGPYPTGDNASGLITFVNRGYYGANTATGFAFPATSVDATSPVYLAGTFNFITTTSGGGSGPDRQAYIASSSAGSQGYFGEIGMEFTVDQPSGIVVKQLGAFDHQGNGITGTQSGGVRVAIFNKNTQTIVPGLDAVVAGTADGYTQFHRLKNVTPVTLMPGTYVVVAKGYNDNELLGNSFLNGPYPAGDNGSGAITFVNRGFYGANTAAGFGFPATAVNATSPVYLAGTFVYTSGGGGGSQPGVTVTITATDTRGNASTATAQVVVLDTTRPVLVPKNITVNLAANGQASIVPGDVIQSLTDNCTVDMTSLTVTPNTFTCADVSGGSGGTTTNHQAYISNTSAGNQAYLGEIGMEFTVNPGPGIVINQLGAFDHQANGISGTQGGGIRVAIFNKNTQTIVPGLDATIVGAGDAFTLNHRFKNISPVTLPAGSYVVVAKGYNAGELLGNSFIDGPYPNGDNASGLIAFVNRGFYGPNTASGFGFPSTSVDAASPVYHAGSFNFITTTGGGSGPGPDRQAYISNTSAGNQSFLGETGMEFTVNLPAGIVIKQLGAFDHQGNGVTGTQSGGVRVAIFNKNTQAIVPGLDAIISGNADAYTLFHRLKNITPVTLLPGTYVVVAKGYNDNELLGNSFLGGPYPAGDNGSGSVTLVNRGFYGDNTASGFTFPANTVNAASPLFLAGTFVYTNGSGGGGGTGSGTKVVTITAKDIYGNTATSSATVTIMDPSSACSPPVAPMVTETLNTEAEGVNRTKALSVYPNPATGLFTVQLSGLKATKVSVQVLNEQGFLIQQKTLNTSGKTASMTTTFDLRNQSAGMYFIKVSGPDGVRTAKVQVQH